MNDSNVKGVAFVGLGKIGYAIAKNIITKSSLPTSTLFSHFDIRHAFDRYVVHVVLNADDGLVFQIRHANAFDSLTGFAHTGFASYLLCTVVDSAAHSA